MFPGTLLLCFDLESTKTGRSLNCNALLGYFYRPT